MYIVWLCLLVSSVLGRELLQIFAAERGISGIYFIAEVIGSPGETISFQIRSVKDDSILFQTPAITNTLIQVTLPKGIREAVLFAEYTAVDDPSTDARKLLQIYKSDEAGYESDFRPFLPKGETGANFASVRPSVGTYIYAFSATQLVEDFTLAHLDPVEIHLRGK